MNRVRPEIWSSSKRCTFVRSPPLSRFFYAPPQRDAPHREVEAPPETYRLSENVGLARHLFIPHIFLQPRFPSGLSRSESKLTSYHYVSLGKRPSFGLVPAEAPIICLENHGFRPGQARRGAKGCLSCVLVACQLLAPTGASPTEA